MILADAAVWIDHLRSADPHLNWLLTAERIVMHPFVSGEVALGSIRERGRVLGDFADLPQMRVATTAQVAHLTEITPLWGKGIGYVDAHLLAATLLLPGASLWTRDKRLRAQAERLDIAYAA